MRAWSILLVFFTVAGIASSCSQEDKLAGHWESDTWSFYESPIFIHFNGDGTWYGTRNDGKNSWNIEKDGYIRIVYPLGGTGKCKYGFTDDGSLEISTGYCFLGVPGLPETVVLQKR